MSCAYIRSIYPEILNHLSSKNQNNSRRGRKFNFFKLVSDPAKRPSILIKKVVLNLPFVVLTSNFEVWFFSSNRTRLQYNKKRINQIHVGAAVVMYTFLVTNFYMYKMTVKYLVVKNFNRDSAITNHHYHDSIAAILRVVILHRQKR